MSFTVDTAHLMDPRRNQPVRVLAIMYRGLICLAALCLVTVIYVQLRTPKPSPVVVSYDGRKLVDTISETSFVYLEDPTPQPGLMETSADGGDGREDAATTADGPRPTADGSSATSVRSTANDAGSNSTVGDDSASTVRADNASTSSAATTTTKDSYTSFDPTARTGRQCYEDADVDPKMIELLDDVLTSDTQPSIDRRSIFFHETSCLSGEVKLNARQACAIESAAVANPESSIFVLFASPVGFGRDQDHPPLFQALGNYTNINLLNLKVTTYAKGTPAENFLARPDLFASPRLTEDLSQILRLVTLFKYGGTHIGLDYVSARALPTSTANYAGLRAEVGEGVEPQLSEGLLSLEADNMGHLFAKDAIQQFTETYDTIAWPQLGPKLLTQSIAKTCRTPDVSKCTIFSALPSATFSPVAAADWQTLFGQRGSAELPASFADAVAVRFWDESSADAPVKMGTLSVYETMAKDRCPRVFETLGGEETF